MKISYSNIFEDVVICEPEQYEDYRGKNIELFNKEIYSQFLDNEVISDKTFIMQSISYSRRNVLRGLHGDFKTFKCVKVLYGEVYLVIADIRRESNTYLQWQSFILSEYNAKQILIPPGFVNGHFVLSDRCIFHYDLTEKYNEKQITIRYDNKNLDIIWPSNNPILSVRDRITNFNGLIDTL